MNDRTLAKLLDRIDNRWPYEARVGTHQEWLEALAHVEPKYARRAFDKLANGAGSAPTAEGLAELAGNLRRHDTWADAAKLEPLPETGWAPLTRKARFRLGPAGHTFWTLTGLVGLRDRLRCPSCTAVGTWKPHGDPLSRIRYGDRPVRRWMCKFCGRYEGPEGITRAWPRSETKVWVVEAPDFTDRELTPLELIAPTWPWRG